MPLWTDRGRGWEKVNGARAYAPAAAFLCCPGPSLAGLTIDLRGPGRRICAINSAYPRVRPDVWIGTDRLACHSSRVWCEAFPKITRRIEGETDKIQRMPEVYVADIEKADPEEMFIRRDNLSSFVWAHNTMTFALHYLVWCGHKTIYLVGCDMGGAADYHDARILSDEQRAYNRRLYSEQVKTLRGLSLTAARNGVMLQSCTPDSPLNEFLPFLTAEQALEAVERDLPPERPILHAIEAEPTSSPAILARLPLPAHA